MITPTNTPPTIRLMLPPLCVRFLLPRKRNLGVLDDIVLSATGAKPPARKPHAGPSETLAPGPRRAVVRAAGGARAMRGEGARSSAPGPVPRERFPGRGLRTAGGAKEAVLNYDRQ